MDEQRIDEPLHSSSPVGCLLRYGAFTAAWAVIVPFAPGPAWAAYLPTGLAMAAAAAVLRHRSDGHVWADESGLEVRWGRERLTAAWGYLVVLQQRGHALSVATSTQAVRMSLADKDTRLYCRLAALRERASSAPDSPIEPAEIAGWLGIDPDGALDLAEPGRPWAAWLAVLVAAITCAGLWAALSHRGEIAARTWSACLAMVAVETLVPPPWHPRWPVGSVTGADAEGLSHAAGRRRGRTPWSAIRVLRHEGCTWFLGTLDGELVLPADAAARPKLVQAAQKLITERSSGRLAPRLDGVSAAALSRADVAIEAGRGLSPVDGGSLE